VPGNAEVVRVRLGHHIFRLEFVWRDQCNAKAQVANKLENKNHRQVEGLKGEFPKFHQRFL